MKKMIYFDNSASSPMCKTAIESLISETSLPANPSSLHRWGFEAQKRLEDARNKIAVSLKAYPEEIIFTSGGTESDNIALFGLAEKQKHKGKHIIISDSEHPAVTESIKHLAESGYRIDTLKTVGGVISEDELREKMTGETVICAIMHTNNETGAKYDIKNLFKTAKSINPDVLTFSDAVQGYLKGEIYPSMLNCDLMSLSSHKIHGPKGVGALYIRNGINIKPHTFGGGQERGLRNGTENLPGIVSFGAAAEYGYRNLSFYVSRMNEIRETIISGLSDNKKIKFNIPLNPSCHIVSMQVSGFKSEVLLHILSDKGIFVSSGSACSSHKGKSHVLENFGLSPKEADCTLRISVSAENTVSEAEEFVKAINEITK